MPSPRFAVLLLALSMAASCPTSASGNPNRVSVIRALSNPPRLQARSAAVRASRYASMPHGGTSADCAATKLPEALATPGPLLQADTNSRITVTFIIGTDGRVHSPFILESSDSDQDIAVLDAVQTWKYRPARCNGVPMEAEGRIEFLSH